MWRAEESIHPYSILVESLGPRPSISFRFVVVVIILVDDSETFHLLARHRVATHPLGPSQVVYMSLVKHHDKVNVESVKISIWESGKTKKYESKKYTAIAQAAGEA